MYKYLCMITFEKHFLENSRKKAGPTNSSYNNIEGMNEGIFKKTLPYVAAGLAGAGAMGVAHSNTESPKSQSKSPTLQVRQHKRSATDIDREIKFKQYQDLMNKKPKAEPPKIQSTEPIAKPESNIIKDMIPAIAHKETGHLSNPDKAVGDHGKAFGRYQIHEEAVKDVNRIYGTHYTHGDMFNPDKAKDVLIKYLTFWGNYNKKHKGIEMTVKNLAAMWNGGGPGGYKNAKALAYANDVVSHMSMNGMLASN